MDNRIYYIIYTDLSNVDNLKKTIKETGGYLEFFYKGITDHPTFYNNAVAFYEKESEELKALYRKLSKQSN